MPDVEAEGTRLWQHHVEEVPAQAMLRTQIKREYHGRRVSATQAAADVAMLRLQQLSAAARQEEHPEYASALDGGAAGGGAGGGGGGAAGGEAAAGAGGGREVVQDAWVPADLPNYRHFARRFNRKRSVLSLEVQYLQGIMDKADYVSQTLHARGGRSIASSFADHCFAHLFSPRCVGLGPPSGTRSRNSRQGQAGQGPTQGDCH